MGLDTLHTTSLPSCRHTIQGEVLSAPILDVNMPVAPHPDVTESRKEMDMAEDHDGSDRCVLEVDGSAAGILLREEDGAYQFFAANPGAALLDRKRFRSRLSAETEVKRVLCRSGWKP
jgi:hypothetical protein